MNRLQEWKEKLLDVSKKNKLVNFTFTKTGPIEILSPAYDEIFDTLTSEKSFYLYDPLYKEKSTIDKETYINDYLKTTPSNSILVYFEHKNVTQKIKEVQKEAKEFKDEKGVNTLFLTIGLLEYKDKKDSMVLNAPLLLLPIRLTLDTKVNKYEIEIIDDPLENITLIKKIYDDYKITIASYNKKKGIIKYLKDASDSLKDLEFKVSSNVYITNISYYKINIYEDLTKNEKQVLQNTNIKRLISDDKFKLKEIKYIESPLKNVCLADSSQNEAVRLSSTGESFVLEGPPGAGKSQTITNIIAKALYDKKKVLFVSEKAAALNVVEDNLEKANLDDYVLNMHSPLKKNKDNIIRDIYDTLMAPKVQIKKDLSTIKEDYERTVLKINKYNDNLYLKNKVYDDESLFEEIENASKYYKSIDVNYEIKEVNNKNKNHLLRDQELLNKYLLVTKNIGEDYRLNPFYGLKKQDYRYNEKDELNKLVSDYSTVINKIIDLNFEIENATGIYPYQKDDLISTQNLFRNLNKYDFFFDKLFEIDNDFYNEVIKINNSLKKEKEIHTEINKYFTDEIFDINEFTLDLILKNNKLFDRLTSNYKEAKKELDKISYKKTSYKKKCTIINLRKEYLKLKNDNDNLLDKISTNLKEYYKGRDTDFDYCIKLIDDIRPYILESIKYDKIKTLSSAEIKNLYIIFDKKIETLLKDESRYEKLLEEYFDNDIYNFSLTPYQDIRIKLKNISQDYSGLQHYTEYLKLEKDLKEEHLMEYLNKFLDTKGRMIDDLVNAYNKIYYNELVHFYISENEIINEISTLDLENLYKEFDKLETQKFEIHKAEIIESCSINKPSSEIITTGSPLSIIKREAEKKRFQMPVRQLMAECGDVIQKIKPCFLMSPLSVSTYFIDSDKIDFDMVIFDEASQIVPEDALAPIFRSKQLIVVGDSKQMPPTNFFQSSNIEDVNITDEDSVMSYESLLDFCSSRFKSTRLNYHYRSKFEDLIAFSNEYIYKKSFGKLMTFPSANIKQKYLGIDLYKVDGGYFDPSTRSNEKEALKIIELVKDHLENNPNRSLGIIAFGIGQQKLIEKLLLKEASHNSLLKEFIYKECEEPFFVRNLENVQGNERDTIILSVAYSKDKNGALKYSFGPINRSGGERRLNVAFTRAKYNVMLVSSIEADDFVAPNETEGVYLLKCYLEYAKTGKFLDVVEEEKEDTNKKEINFFDTHNYIKDEIKDFLTKEGYDVVSDVGSSDYPVDLGIRSTINNKYILGVDIDSYKFREIKTIRDYSIRKSVLAKLGWHYYKVNVVEWAYNKDGEKKRILSKIKEAFSDSDMPQTFEPTDGLDILEATINEPFGDYIAPDYTSSLKEYNKDKNFNNLIYSCLKNSSPLLKVELLKGILPIFYSDTITQNVKLQFEVKLDRIKGNKEVDSFLFLKYQKIIPLRVIKNDYRDINTIAKEELAGGIYKIISLNGEASEEGIIKEISNAINCKRITKNVSYKIVETIKYLLRNGYVKEKDGLYSIKKEIKE